MLTKTDTVFDGFVVTAEDHRRLTFIREQLTGVLYGPPPVKGIVLAAPPAGGKSVFTWRLGLVTSALAQRITPSTISPYGENVARTVAELFRAKSEAYRETGLRQFVVFDEFEAFAPATGANDVQAEFVNALAAVLDLMRPTDGIFVIAETCYPEAIAPQLLVPGRLDQMFTLVRNSLDDSLDDALIRNRRFSFSPNVVLQPMEERRVTIGDVHVSTTSAEEIEAVRRLLENK